MSDAATRSPREIIDQLKDALTRVREERDRVEADRVRLERERDRLRRENERLRQQLDAARRAGFRQAAPFSKGAPLLGGLLGRRRISFRRPSGVSRGKCFVRSRPASCQRSSKPCPSA